MVLCRVRRDRGVLQAVELVLVVRIFFPNDAFLRAGLVLVLFTQVLFGA